MGGWGFGGLWGFAGDRDLGEVGVPQNPKPQNPLKPEGPEALSFVPVRKAANTNSTSYFLHKLSSRGLSLHSAGAKHFGVPLPLGEPSQV